MHSTTWHPLLYAHIHASFSLDKPAFICWLFICRLAEFVKGRNIFTRSQQSTIFKAAYRKVPVSCVCLRNLGNFKALFHATTKKIPNITKPRSFLIERRDGEVRVLFKEFMHSPEWTGMDRDARFSASAPSHRVFIGPVPRIRDAPAYTLKVVEEKTIKSIEQRYKSSHARLEATYPCGEWKPRPKHCQQIVLTKAFFFNVRR